MTKRANATEATTTPAANGHRPTTICFVRHGETDWNRQHVYQGTSDVPLNALGRHQAEVAAGALKDGGWTAVVSSPLQRALETARLIAAAIGVERVEERTDLVERAYGAAEGLTLEEANERWPKHWWPGLEPRPSLNKRAMGALRAIGAAHPGERVVVVTHGGVINAILAQLSNGELGSGKTRLLNASLTTLVGQGERWKIESYNITDHLADLDMVMPGI